MPTDDSARLAGEIDRRVRQAVALLLALSLAIVLTFVVLSPARGPVIDGSVSMAVIG